MTISKEDYLKAIAEAEAEGETVISAMLANWLSVTRPAVTAALKRLNRDGLARVEKDGRIRLTAAGRAAAERTIFRHHLIERMLIELFGMPWHAVHDEAERLEHVVSPAFEKRLLAKLGKSDFCPHGNAWSLKSTAERRKGLCRLDEALEKQRYRVTSVAERDRKLLQFFDQEGIRPGATVIVQAKHYDGTTTLAIGQQFLRLGDPAARKIWVQQA
jgi:DtxR family transcriptional regulator, iron-dependent repressor